MNGKGVYVDAEEEVEPVMHASCKANGKEGRRQKSSRGKQVGLGPQGKKQVQGSKHSSGSAHGLVLFELDRAQIISVSK